MCGSLSEGPDFRRSRRMIAATCTMTFHLFCDNGCIAAGDCDLRMKADCVGILKYKCSLERVSRTCHAMRCCTFDCCTKSHVDNILQDCHRHYTRLAAEFADN